MEPLQTLCKPVAKRSSGSDGEITAVAVRSPQNAKYDDSRAAEAAQAFCNDMAEVRNAIADILAADDITAAAKAVAPKIPSMMPRKSELAGVLRETMIDGVAQVAGGSKRSDNRVLDNSKNSACRSKNPLRCPVHGKGSITKEDRKAWKESAPRREKEAREKFSRVESGQDVKNFMESLTIGQIDFPHSAYIHIKTKFEQGTTNFDDGHQEMLKDNNIAKTLAYGSYYIGNARSGYTKTWNVINGNKMVVVGVPEKGERAEIITAYVSDSKAKYFRERGTKIENAEVHEGRSIHPGDLIFTVSPQLQP